MWENLLFDDLDPNVGGGLLVMTNRHSTESDSDFGHGTAEQNWYTFRQSHINVLCSIQRE